MRMRVHLRMRMIYATAVWYLLNYYYYTQKHTSFTTVDTTTQTVMTDGQEKERAAEIKI